MTLEQEIANKINDSIGTAITATLTGYNSPLVALIKEVVNEQSITIKEIVSSVLSEFATSQVFKNTLKEEMNHKLAKSCVSLLESQVDRSLNSIKQDPMIRAKMVIALENVIKENQC